MMIVLRPGRILLTREQINERVTNMGQEITTAVTVYPEEVVALVILKGAMIFAADLIRHIPLPLTLDFVRAISYDGDTSTGTVSIDMPSPACVTGKTVLILEDIVDTGRTLQSLIARLQQQEPARILICALLDKPSRRVVPIQADYVGFTIGDVFVAGYGLDYYEEHRNADHIFELIRE